MTCVTDDIELSLHYYENIYFYQFVEFDARRRVAMGNSVVFFNYGCDKLIRREALHRYGIDCTFSYIRL